MFAHNFSQECSVFMWHCRGYLCRQLEVEGRFSVKLSHQLCSVSKNTRKTFGWTGSNAEIFQLKKLWNNTDKITGEKEEESWSEKIFLLLTKQLIFCSTHKQHKCSLNWDFLKNKKKNKPCCMERSVHTQLTTLLVMWLGKSTLTIEELQWSAASIPDVTSLWFYGGNVRLGGGRPKSRILALNPQCAAHIHQVY